jgi:hypothetical protein
MTLVAISTEAQNYIREILEIPSVLSQYEYDVQNFSAWEKTMRLVNRNPITSLVFHG